MKFYCLITNTKQLHNAESLAYLEEACATRGLTFITIKADTFDYSQEMDRVIETPSLLYRLGIGKRTAMLEALLANEGVVTFYVDPVLLFQRGFSWGATIQLQKAGLPIIPTIFNVDARQDERLASYVESLGGFPVILKASGGSHGGSVLRLDSLESLRSVLGYVTENTAGNFVLRSYIHAANHLRMVVVGNRVVDAIRYLPRPDDFRTNAVATPQVEAYKRNTETEHYFALAAEAVSVLGLEFGGVDLLLDKKGKPYIAEVNYPCNFARNQMNTGTDIAGIMVDHLLAKVKSGISPR